MGWKKYDVKALTREGVVTKVKKIFRYHYWKKINDFLVLELSSF